MAWTSPTTWVTGNVVTASQLNTHIRDNLNYLKASPVFDGTPVVGATGSPQSLTVFGNANGATNGPLFVKNTSAGTIGAGIALDASGATSGRSFSLLAIANAVAPVGGFGIYDNTAAAFRMVVDSTGKVGIGTTAPAGPLEVKGAGGGRILMLSADDVTTLQTIAVAGTVVSGATFFIMDRNNTTTTCFQGAAGTALQLSGSSSYANTDTITYAVTAGGAITVQRTSGTNGSHDMTILCFVY